MKKIYFFLVTILLSVYLHAQSNYALSFNGSNNYVAIPTMWNSNFNGQTAITVEFWFKGSNAQSAFRAQISGNYFVAPWSTEPQYIISTDGGIPGISAGANATITNGSWHHMAMSWSQGGTFVSYLDGAVVASRAASGSATLPIGAANTYLGCYDGTGEFMTGSLDELRVWNVVRSQAQIQANMNNELVGNEAGLVVYYNMNAGSGTTLTDITGHGYNGNISGSTWVTGAGVSPLPVELVSFSAVNNNNLVSLTWQTATEVNNYGFEIERLAISDKLLAKSQHLSSNGWGKIGFIQGHGNSNSPKNYSFEDVSPLSGIVQYRLKQIDFDGKYEYSDIVEVNINTPANFNLSQNYPNPFNPETTISYKVQAAGNVSLKIYDILGRELVTLVNEYKQAGTYNSQFSIRNYQLPSGIYFYRLQSGSYSETKKFVLVK